jgi:serine/threonine protein kinase
MKYCPLCEKSYGDDVEVCTLDGAALRDSRPNRDTLSGKVIKGRYRVLEKLGEGGMGTVYLAEQVAISRKVALKILRPDYTSDQEFVRRFRQEAKLAASFSHRNVVTVFDFDQADDGSLYIVMEYVDGESLADVIRNGPMDISRGLQLAAQIADGLNAAHRAGVIHRDVKPENIMVVGEGEEIKLMDFGIARLRDTGATSRLTRAGTIMGTPAYMAPEQIEGQEVSERTDIYAFGIVLYEILSGTVPFRAPTPGAVLIKHLQETAVPLRKLRSDVPVLVERVVIQALQKDPANRPARMEEVVQALKRAQLQGFQKSSHVSWVARGPWAKAWGFIASVPLRFNRSKPTLPSGYKISPEGEKAFQPERRDKIHITPETSLQPEVTLTSQTGSKNIAEGVKPSRAGPSAKPIVTDNLGADTIPSLELEGGPLADRQIAAEPTTLIEGSNAEMAAPTAVSRSEKATQIALPTELLDQPAGGTFADEETAHQIAAKSASLFDEDHGLSRSRPSMVTSGDALKTHLVEDSDVTAKEKSAAVGILSPSTEQLSEQEANKLVASESKKFVTEASGALAETDVVPISERVAETGTAPPPDQAPATKDIYSKEATVQTTVSESVTLAQGNQQTSVSASSPLRIEAERPVEAVSGITVFEGMPEPADFPPGERSVEQNMQMSHERGAMQAVEQSNVDVATTDFTPTPKVITDTVAATQSFASAPSEAIVHDFVPVKGTSDLTPALIQDDDPGASSSPALTTLPSAEPAHDFESLNKTVIEQNVPTEKLPIFSQGKGGEGSTNLNLRGATTESVLGPSERTSWVDRDKAESTMAVPGWSPKTVRPGKINLKWVSAGILAALIAGVVVFQISRQPPPTKETSSLPPPPPQPVNLVSLVVTGIPSELKLNEYARLTVKGRYSNGKEVNNPNNIRWESTDPNVAGVNTRGELEARGAGSAQITAKYEGVASKTFVVTVKADKAQNPDTDKSIRDLMRRGLR